MKINIKKEKIFYMIFLVIAGILILSALFYKNEYRNVKVFEDNYGMQAGTTGYLEGETNGNLFSFFANTSDNTFEHDFNVYAKDVKNFQVTLNEINNLILYFGIVALVSIAIMMIFSNHNRNVYYKSNLITGIVFPLLIITLTIVLLVKNSMAMVDFTKHQELYNRVSVLMGKHNTEAIQAITNIEKFKSFYDCSISTFIIFDLIFVLVVAYAIFIMVFTCLKYKNTSEKRKEILSRVVLNND